MKSFSLNLVHAKSTDELNELISFGFNDRLVCSQRNAERIAASKRKTTSLFV